MRSLSPEDKPFTHKEPPSPPTWARRDRCATLGRHLVVAQSDNGASPFVLEARGASGLLTAPETALPESSSLHGQADTSLVVDVSVRTPRQPHCVQGLY